MKITCPAGALARVLAFVGRAAARPATTQPVLASALFEADKASGILRIAATDTELTARLSSGMPEIEEAGKAALPCRMLHDVVRALEKEKNVHIEADDKVATLATQDGKNAYSLRLHDVRSLPALSEFPAGDSFTLRAKTLAEAIASVATAAATDDTRPVLTGVLLAFGSEGATVVATDSYRMALYSGKLEGAPKEGRAIIPARALKEVARLCGMGPEKIEVAITENAAMFRAGGVMLTTRLIAGQFPDHTKLIPAEAAGGGRAFARVYAADAGALIEALGRVSLFARRSSGAPVPVTLSFSGSPEAATLEGSASVGISAVSPEVGSATENVPAEPVMEGPDSSEGAGSAERMTISFNPEFLMQAVKTCCRSAGEEPQKVLFCLGAPLKPAVIRPQGNSPVMTLIMPMRNPNPEAEAKDEPV